MPQSRTYSSGPAASSGSRTSSSGSSRIPSCTSRTPCGPTSTPRPSMPRSRRTDCASGASGARASSSSRRRRPCPPVLSTCPTRAVSWRSRRQSMLRDRVITAIALVAALLAALFWLPPAGWTALSAALLAIAAWEWAGFARVGARGRFVYAAATTGAGLTAAYASGLAEGGAGLLALAPLYALALAFWVIGAPLWLARQPAAPPAALVLAVGWIVLLPTFLALVQLRNFGAGTLLAFMGTVWV